MWAEFCLASLLGACLLYVPGFVFFRAMKLSSFAAFVCAPFFDVVAYCAVGIAFFYAGIRSTTLLVVAFVLAISLGVYAIAFLVEHRASATSVVKRFGGKRFDVCCILVYLLVGLVVALFVFLLPLNGPESSVQTYDNVHHFALVQSFVESGDWSSLSTSPYLFVSNPQANPLPGAAYYPAGWHVMCAMLVDGLGVGVSLAANAITFLFVAVVFPASVALLMRTLFPDNRTLVLLGAICPLALGAFPWVLVEVWPLYPNTVSLALSPALIACFVAVCGRGKSKRERISFGATFVIGLACMAFLQPSSVFTAAVFLTPYCVYRIGCEANRRFAGTRHCRMGVLVFSTLTAVLIAVVWVLMCDLPFMQWTVGFYWPPIMGRAQGLLSVAGMAFAGSAVQPIAVIFVVVGALYTFRHRRYMWLSCSYLLMCFIYYVSAVEGDTWFKHVVSGFWYTDPYRTAACAAIFALPLLAMGLYGVYEALKKALVFFGAKNRSREVVLPAMIVVSVFVFFNFFPIRALLGTGSSAFEGIVTTATAFNDGSAMGAYDEGEQNFVRKAEKFVPEDALIVNQPYDGSLFAYGLDGMNLYYRKISGYGGEDETPESVIVRKGLANWMSDAEVQDALRSIGAEYVLILERDPDRAKELFFLYNESDWVGIETIDDATLGFETVLKDDDMRLYRITNADALQ